MSPKSAAQSNKSFAIGGTGLCPEAQADGVPCTELGRDCEICERAKDWLQPVEPVRQDVPRRPVR